MNYVVGSISIAVGVIIILYWVVDLRKRVSVLDFIEAIRKSREDNEIAYTNGGCYQFYKILKSVFPEAEPYYNSDHVITKIGNNFYDISGVVTDVSEHYLPLDDFHHLTLKVLESWKYTPILKKSDVHETINACVDSVKRQTYKK